MGTSPLRSGKEGSGQVPSGARFSLHKLSDLCKTRTAYE